VDDAGYSAGSGLVSPAAGELRVLATAVSAVCGRPGFVSDGYLARLSGDELGHPGADPAVLAAELCGAGIWERAEGGYRVLDAEAVQVCVDRVRELREEDAWLAGLPDRARSEPAVGATGTTRFGNRIREWPDASFRCGECGEIAGVVRVARARGRVILEHFLGTTWHRDAGDVLDAVQALIEQGNVDPAVIREISWTLWDITPFYCPECRLNYCRLDWDMHFAVNPGSHDCVIGTCPSGHRHLLG
jgi:hypothetical protein